MRPTHCAWMRCYTATVPRKKSSFERLGKTTGDPSKRTSADSWAYVCRFFFLRVPLFAGCKGKTEGAPAFRGPPQTKHPFACGSMTGSPVDAYFHVFFSPPLILNGIYRYWTYFFFPGGIHKWTVFSHGESQILGYWFGLFGDLKPRVLYRHGTPLKYPLFGSIDWWLGDLNLGSCRGKMDNYPKATFNQTTNSNHQSKVN